jgi:ribonuclease HI
MLQEISEFSTRQSVVIYTDGSCIQNGKKGSFGGIGAFFGPGDARNISECVRFGGGGGKKVTNQSTELLACVRALAIVFNDPGQKEPDVVIKTDSEYLVKSMNTWAASWSTNGWKTRDGRPIANLASMQRLYDFKRKHGVRFVHVRAHGSEPSNDQKGTQFYRDWYGNNEADGLARKGTAKCRNNEEQIREPISRSAGAFRCSLL